MPGEPCVLCTAMAGSNVGDAFFLLHDPRYRILIFKYVRGDNRRCSGDSYDIFLAKYVKLRRFISIIYARAFYLPFGYYPSPLHKLPNVPEQ